MARLTAATRKKIPSKDFAGGGRSYPIEDRSHARDALSMVSRYGDSAKKARVRAAVHSKYPNMGREGVYGSDSDKWLDRQKYKRG